MTPIQIWKKVRRINENASSFAAKIPTITMPAGDGVVKIENGEDTLELLVYGLGANNDAFDFRVTGWRKTNFIQPLWMPTIICEVSAVISSSVPGTVLSELLATEFFADTLTLNKGVAVVPTVTGDACAALCIVDITGCDRWELTSDQTTNSPTVNALYAQYTDIQLARSVP